MNTSLTPRDWQEISAYLDQQLNSAAQARLEARLAHEPELSQALENLRRQRALLRGLPRRRAPRNFTLTLAMAGRPTRQPGYPALRLVSALASLVLVVLLVGELVNQRFGMPQVASDLQVEMVEEEAPVMLMQEAAPAAELEQPAESAPEAGALAPLPTTPVEEARKAAESTPADAPSAKMIAPEETPAPAMLEAAPVEAETAILDSAPEDAAATAVESPAPRPQVFGLDRSLWRALEILAGFLAVLTGLAWWRLRRRR
ncbi:MAG: hypothetical protein MUE67_00465 [Anaerolineales bacterium]|nr:hypothetical protein [Anaerolineales bacterium]